jgi:hypothetical protein
MSVGPITEKVVRHFLNSGTVPEQGYKACASLTKLGERRMPVGEPWHTSIRNIGSLLKNGQDGL